MAKTSKKCRKSKRNRNKKVIEDKMSPAPAEIELDSVSSSTPSEIAQKFLSEAEAHIESFNYLPAIESCQKALDVDASNVEARETLAGIHVETGDWASAESLYLQCIELSPDKGYAKYLSLGQIYSGKKSIEFYEKGISTIEKLIEQGEDDQPSDISTHLNRVISEAYCSIAEVYMTDCCDEKNAEDLCKVAISKSISSDPTNPEAYQSLADFHLTSGNEEEAKSAVTKSLSLWLPNHRIIQDENELNSAHEFSVPGYDSRIKTSKLLIELNMWQEAIEVLDGLIAENDEIVDVWYLKGYATALQGGRPKNSAGIYFNKAKEVAVKINDDAEYWISHVDQLMKDLKISSEIIEESDEEDEEVDFSDENEDEIESSDED